MEDSHHPDGGMSSQRGGVTNWEAHGQDRWHLPGPCFTKGLIQALSLGSGEEQAV